MQWLRMYTGPDGLSHFEDVDVPLLETEVKSAVRPWYLSDPVAVTSAQFVYRDEAAGSLDWHNAPRRQLVVRLSGEVDLEVSGGEIRRMQPGSVLLAEDTTGQGHRSLRASGESVVVFLPLAP
jgi:quercetin dioxygenase-like cupin family protein